MSKSGIFEPDRQWTALHEARVTEALGRVNEVIARLADDRARLLEVASAARTGAMSPTHAAEIAFIAETIARARLGVENVVAKTDAEMQLLVCLDAIAVPLAAALPRAPAKLTDEETATADEALRTGVRAVARLYGMTHTVLAMKFADPSVERMAVRALRVWRDGGTSWGARTGDGGRWEAAAALLGMVPGLRKQTAKAVRQAYIRWARGRPAVRAFRGETHDRPRRRTP